jgi:hypothetical protein
MNPISTVATRTLLLAAGAGLLVLSSGCTALDEQRKLTQEQQQYDYTQRQYQQALRQNQALNDENRRLASELASRQMELAEFNARLAQLQEGNAKRMAITDVQRQKKKQVDDDINRMRGEIGNMQRRNDLSDAEKRKRLAAMQDELTRELSIGLYN